MVLQQNVSVSRSNVTTMMMMEQLIHRVMMKSTAPGEKGATGVGGAEARSTLYAAFEKYFTTPRSTSTPAVEGVGDPADTLTGKASSIFPVPTW